MFINSGNMLKLSYETKKILKINISINNIIYILKINKIRL